MLTYDGFEINVLGDVSKRIRCIFVDPFDHRMNGPPHEKVINGKDVFRVPCALKVPAELAVQQLILVDIREKADHTATSMMLMPCKVSSSTESFCRRFALVTVSVITLCSVLVAAAISFLAAGFW